MSDRPAYATLGQYAQLARQQAEAGGRWYEFPELSRLLLERGNYTELPPETAAQSSVEDLDTFRRNVYGTAVEVRKCTVGFDAWETVAFSADYIRREVIGGVQLPFVYSPLFRTDSYYMYYIYAGTGTLRLEQGEKTYRAGSVVLIAPHVLHRFQVDKADTLVLAFYIFNSVFERSFWHQLGNNDLLSNFLAQCQTLGSSRPKARERAFATKRTPAYWRRRSRGYGCGSCGSCGSRRQRALGP